MFEIRIQNIEVIEIYLINALFSLSTTRHALRVLFQWFSALYFSIISFYTLTITRCVSVFGKLNHAEKCALTLLTFFSELWLHLALTDLCLPSEEISDFDALKVDRHAGVSLCTLLRKHLGFSCSQSIMHYRVTLLRDYDWSLHWV